MSLDLGPWMWGIHRANSILTFLIQIIRQHKCKFVFVWLIVQHMFYFKALPFQDFLWGFYFVIEYNISWQDIIGFDFCIVFFKSMSKHKIIEIISTLSLSINSWPFLTWTSFSIFFRRFIVFRSDVYLFKNVQLILSQTNLFCFSNKDIYEFKRFGDEG